MHAYLSGCLLQSEWMWSLYIIFITTFLFSVLVSASLEHQGFSSLSVSLSTRILALLHAVEGDINDRNQSLYGAQ